MKKHGNAGKIVSVVIVLAVLIVAVGLVAFFTNGFTSDFKTFYVESNGKKILTDINGFVLQPETENRFDVKYTFGKVNKEVSGYSVKIVPNVNSDNDFDFTVDGEIYSFGAESELTKGFDIAYEKDYFTLSGGFSMQSVLERIYPEQTVAFNHNDVNYEVDNFTLLIYSYNNEAVIKIGFRNYQAVDGVELQDTLIFRENIDGTVSAS